jgi:hypothetical protein
MMGAVGYSLNHTGLGFAQVGKNNRMTVMQPPKPDFIIVGAAKCGTTALAALLKQHPDIFISSPGEPRYFAREALRRTSRLDPQYDYLQRSCVLIREDYCALFKNTEQYKARGESSVHYLYHHKVVIPNILKELGDVKILILLRNPAIRALSNYYYLRRETLSLPQALIAEKDRQQKGFNSFWYYKDQGLYHDKVKAYLDHFSGVKIILFNQFKKNPMGVCQEVFNFLGVSANYPVDLHIDYNTTLIPKSKFWKFVLAFEKTPVVQKVILPLFGRFFREVKKNWLQRPDYYRDTLIYNQLVDYYLEDIAKLEKLLGVNLSRWKAKLS